MQRRRHSPLRTVVGLFALILGLTALNTRACAPHVAAWSAAGHDGSRADAIETAGAVPGAGMASREGRAADARR